MNKVYHRSVMTLRLWLGLLLLSCCPATQAAAEELYVITSPDVELSADDIRDVYLGEKLFAGSTRLVPIDNATAQTEFLTRIMMVDATKYGSIWIKKGFREGLTAPGIKSNDVDVIAYVRRTPGAIGYVTSLHVLPATLGIKVVKRL